MRSYRKRILSSKYYISYNAVTKKFMLIALKRVCDRLNWPESSFDLEGIAQISSGDLHAALSALQLSGMRMSPSAKRLKTDEKFVSSEKDEMLLIFHALGKFLYNKRNIHSGFDSAGKVKQIPWEQMQGIKPGLYFNPESVLRSVESDLGVFNMMLYENYLDFFGEIEDVVEGLEGFMLSDKIDSYKFLYESEDFNLALLSSSIFGRSILDSNCHPSPPKALNKFRKPRYLQMHKVIQENKESLLLKWGSSLRHESLETTIQEIWAFERRRENSNIDSVLITQAEEELDSLNIDV